MAMLIVLVYPKAESLSNDQKEKIDKGLTAGNAIVQLINNRKFSKTLTKISSSIGPYLGAVGPFIGVTLAFIPSESDELQFLKGMMKTIDNKFDRVDLRFDNIGRKIDWSSVKVNFGQIEQKIRAMSREVKHLYEVPKSAVANRRLIFIKHYESDYQSSGTKLYHAVMLRKGLSVKNICASVMKYTSFDRKDTHRFLLEIVKLLIEAARIELTYMRSMKYYYNEKYTKIQWEKRFRNVKRIFLEVDRTVKNSYHYQSGKDTSKFAVQNRGMSNRKFGLALFNMLRRKYYWRDWIVVVYKDISGRNNHCVSVCGGHTKLHTKGRNILIASVDKRSRVMDLARAKRDMKNVSVTRRMRGFWWHRYYKKRSARDIYNSLNKHGACSAGVIKWDSNLWFFYTNRLKYVKRKPYYTLFMWG